MASSEWDIEKLKEDIKKYTKRRNELTSTICKMEEAKKDAEDILRQIPDEDNPWKQRYLEKQEENVRKQKELNDLLRPRKESSNTVASAVSTVKKSENTLEKMSDLALHQLQRKLEKDRTEMEWKLKEYGWRLDQTSAALSRAEEEKLDILTQIGHAVIKQKDAQKGGIKKSQSQ